MMNNMSAVYLVLFVIANIVMLKIAYDSYIYFFKKPKKEFYQFNIFQNMLGSGEYNKIIKLQELDS